MKVKIAYCEDNPSIRSSIASFFDQMCKEDDIEVAIDYYSNGEQLLSNHKADYDIYLLDINMGDNNLNGMTIAQTIRKHDNSCLIIFLTSMTRYLKEGYKVKAYRYLTKPICYNEFKSEISCAISDVKRNQTNFINLLGHAKINKIMSDDIFYIETHGRKTLIHTRTGDISCSYPISTLAEMLEDKNFFRCHNSYIINISYVEYLDHRIVRVRGVDILVSRNRMKGLREAVINSPRMIFLS